MYVEPAWRISRFLVYNPFLFIQWGLDISIGRVAGDVLPSLATQSHHRSDFFAGIPGVVVVKDVFEYREVVFPLALSTSSLMAIKRTS